MLGSTNIRKKYNPPKYKAPKINKMRIIVKTMIINQWTITATIRCGIISPSLETSKIPHFATLNIPRQKFAIFDIKELKSLKMELIRVAEKIVVKKQYKSKNPMNVSCANFFAFTIFCKRSSSLTFFE